jgi:esterase FrsA
MSYEFPVDVHAVWAERAPQFLNLGIPRQEIDHLVGVVDDMWADRPGGWCFEWSALADRYARAGQPGLAATAYGAARFPCLADGARVKAHRHQLEQYELAAPGFPVTFERRRVTTHLRGEVVEVPVHVLAETDAPADTPVLVTTGGIDTGKVDLHPVWVSYVRGAHVRVVACDIPGTGELTPVPLGRETTEVLDGVVAFARTLTTGKVGQLGLSFGGYFSAHAGLTELVDAAVVVGGPVSRAFSSENARALLYGMQDIFGNAAGFTSVPTTEQVVEVAASFAMDDLLARTSNSPMLVINGDEDVHVPLADTTVFDGRPDTEVRLVRGGTHCAFNKLDELLAATTAWLTAALH